jgi:hypothetical protein
LIGRDYMPLARFVKARFAGRLQKDADSGCAVALISIRCYNYFYD